jgi:hypothetical protein
VAKKTEKKTTVKETPKSWQQEADYQVMKSSMHILKRLDRVVVNILNMLQVAVIVLVNVIVDKVGADVLFGWRD